MLPQDAFEMLVKKLIRHLREPSAWCANAFLDELRLIYPSPKLKLYH
jgi:hypothetical protein